MSETKLINYRTYNLDRSEVIPIDRRTIFGNPFFIGIDGNREDVIEKYRKQFYKKLITDKFYQEVCQLKGCILGCWCTPLPCHGDVIIEYLEGLE